MTTKADITINEGARRAFFHKPSDGYPSGFADTLRAALQMSRRHRPLDSQHLPPIRLEHIQNGHGDSSWRYEVTHGDSGNYTVRVLSLALDLKKPCDSSGSGFEIDSRRRHVPIFDGPLEQFLEWSQHYDADSEEAIAKLQSASKA